MLRHYLELPLSVRVLCLGSLVNRAGSFVIIFLTIYASEVMGFGIGFATACIGVLGLGSMTGSIIGGHLADRLGRRRVMLLALLGGGGALLLLGELRQQWSFLLVVALFAVINDMYRPAASAMIADLVAPQRRSHAFALMYLSINLGFAIAPPLGGLLAEFSYRLLFWADAFSMILFSGIIAACIPESRPAVEPTGDGSDAASGNLPRQTVVSDYHFVGFCLAGFLTAIVFMQGFSTLPIHIRQSGFSNLEFGCLMSVNGLLIALFQLPTTHWTSRFRPMSVLVTGGVLIAIGFGLNAFGATVGILLLTITVWTIGEILQAPYNQSIVTQLAPPELRGRYLGVFSLAIAAAITIGAPLGGQLLDQFGPAVLWTTMSCIALVAVVIYIGLRGAIGKRIESVTNA